VPPAFAPTSRLAHCHRSAAMISACPACNSTDLEVILSSSGRMQFLNDRKCNRCGTRWTPPCPRWAAWLAVTVGALSFAAVVAGVVASHMTGQIGPAHRGYVAGMVLWTEVLLAALGSVVYGACVLAGATGGLAIKPADGPAPQAVPAAAGKAAARPGGPGVRWFHFAAAALLPIVGLPWGLVELLRERWKPGLLLTGLSVLSLAFVLLVMLSLLLAYLVPPGVL